MSVYAWIHTQAKRDGEVQAALGGELLPWGDYYLWRPPGMYYLLRLPHRHVVEPFNAEEYAAAQWANWGRLHCFL